MGGAALVFMFSLLFGFGGGILYVLGYQGQGFVVPLLTLMTIVLFVLLMLYLFFLGTRTRTNFDALRLMSEHWKGYTKSPDIKS